MTLYNIEYNNKLLITKRLYIEIKRGLSVAIIEMEERKCTNSGQERILLSLALLTTSCIFFSKSLKVLVHGPPDYKCQNLIQLANKNLCDNSASKGRFTVQRKTTSSTSGILFKCGWILVLSDIIVRTFSRNHPSGLYCPLSGLSHPVERKS